MYKLLVDGVHPSFESDITEFVKGKIEVVSELECNMEYYVTHDGERYFSKKLHDIKYLGLSSAEFEASIVFSSYEDYYKCSQKKTDKMIVSMNWDDHELDLGIKKNNYEFGIEFSDAIVLFDVKRQDKQAYETLAEEDFFSFEIMARATILTTQEGVVAVSHLFDVKEESFHKNANLTGTIISVCTEEQDWKTVLSSTEYHILYSTKRTVYKLEKQKDRFASVESIIEMDPEGEFYFNSRGDLRQEGFNHESDDCTITCREWNKNFAPDNLFSNRVYSHGLATGFTSESKGVFEKSKIEPDWEICCSEKDQYTGDIGLFVMGRVLMASSEDLYTSRSDKGRTLDVSGHYTRAKAVSTNLETYLSNIKDYGRTEVIMDQTRIVGVWFKGAENERLATLMAQYHCVKAYNKSRHIDTDGDL